MDLDARLRTVGEYLDGRFGLEALLVFGSEASGLAGADSDVDLAAFRASLPTHYSDLKRVRAAAEASLIRRAVHGRS
jgi:predicted nucleotidyltransferase